MLGLSQKITYILLWLTISTVPFQKSFVVPGLGSLNKVVGIILAAVVIFAVLLKGEFKKLPIFYVLLFSFIFLNIASFFWAKVPNDALDRSILFLQLGFIAWAIYEFASDKERLNGLLKAFVLGCSVIGIQSIFQYLTGSYQLESSTRFFVEGYNPNAIGIIWTLALPMAIFLGVNGSRIFSLYIPIALFAVLLTGSRTALILLSIVTICSLWLLFKYRIRFRKLIALSLIIVGWIVASQLPPGQVERFSTLGDELTGGTLNGRTVIWESGLETFTRNPIVGVGSGSYQEAAALYGVEMSSHNSYLSILTENGLIGIGLFVGMLIILFTSSYSLDRRNPYRWLCLTLITTWLILSVVSHAEAQKYTWIVFGIILAAYHVNGQQPVKVGIEERVTHKTNKRNFFGKRIVW